MSFPPDFLDTLRDRVSLADVVGRRVPFDRRKSNPRRRDYWACCPFHGEQTPSFHVDDAKGFYHCFGCGVSGDAIGFVQAMENVSFTEAVERLAEQAGLPIPARDPREDRRREQRKSLSEVLALALRFYVQSLARSAAARRYLEARNCGPAAWQAFEMGFAPAGRTALFEHLKGHGVAPALMAEAGLVSIEDGRDPLDRFRGRVMFPIRDARERLVGFGGRILESDTHAPKYLNSPETALFDKGRLLFNHARARKALREAGTLVVVEGYMDVIALHGAGLDAAVAPLGTALTLDQLRLLWRETGEPILCFDGDAAGRRAAHRALDLALPHVKAGQTLRFVVLPEGQDPDDVIRAQGADGMRAALAAPLPLVDMLWERECDAAPFDTPERRADLERRLTGCARKIEDGAVRNHYEAAFRQRLRALFGGAPAPVPGARREAGGFRGRPPAAAVSSHLRRSALAQAALRSPAGALLSALPPEQAPALIEDLEACLVLLLIDYPELVERVAESLGLTRFMSGKLDKICSELIHLVSERGGLDSGALQDHLISCGIHRAVADFAGRPLMRQMRASWAALSLDEGERLWRGFAVRHDRALRLRSEIEEAHAAALGEGTEAERHLHRLKALLAERQSLEAEQLGPRDGKSLNPGG